MGTEEQFNINPEVVSNIRCMYNLLKELSPGHGLLKYFNIRDLYIDAEKTRGVSMIGLSDDPKIRLEFGTFFGRDDTEQALIRYLNLLETSIYSVVFKTPGELENFLEGVNLPA